MTIVNFTITDPLEKKIEQALKDEGFLSRAELFRFAVINYLNNLDRQMSENEEFAYLTSRLRNLIHLKFGRKKLTSVRKQLSAI